MLERAGLSEIDLDALMESVSDEADLCRNETANDIADLLDKCHAALSVLREDLAGAYRGQTNLRELLLERTSSAAVAEVENKRLLYEALNMIDEWYRCSRDGRNQNLDVDRKVWEEWNDELIERTCSLFAAHPEYFSAI